MKNYFNILLIFFICITYADASNFVSLAPKGVTLQEITELIKVFVVKNPQRSVNRDFNGGGKHNWGSPEHHISGGRGLFGTYWQCKNPNCKYYDQASLYDTIAESPPCSARCTQCGDWQYNCRATCPNAIQSENIYRYHSLHQMDQDNEGNGWTLDGLSFKAPLCGTNGAVPVLKYHYDQSQTYGGWRYLFTADPNQQTGGWTFDEIGFFAFKSAMPNTVPIYLYKFLQSDGARFFLSRGQNTQGWTRVGVAFWAYPI